MRKFLLMSHGKFAEGLNQSLSMLVGTTENIYVYSAYLEETKESIQSFIKRHCSNINKKDEVIILTDLLGGSVTNECVAEVVESQYENVYIIAGMNLVLVLDLVLADQNRSIDQILDAKIAGARDGIVLVNKA